jgi:hypothetical protein
MARPKLHVLHFLVCPRITVNRAGPENPYTLHDVNYPFELSADREFPVTEPELWGYLRVFNGRGRREFAIEVMWLDGPRGPEVTAVYTMPPVTFLGPDEVVCRAWKLAFVSFPGLGRYSFRLGVGRRNRLLAEDVIEVRKSQ